MQHKADYAKQDIGRKSSLIICFSFQNVKRRVSLKELTDFSLALQQQRYRTSSKVATQWKNKAFDWLCCWTMGTCFLRKASNTMTDQLSLPFPPLVWSVEAFLFCLLFCLHGNVSGKTCMLRISLCAKHTDYVWMKGRSRLSKHQDKQI